MLGFRETALQKRELALNTLHFISWELTGLGDREWLTCLPISLTPFQEAQHFCPETETTLTKLEGTMGTLLRTSEMAWAGTRGEAVEEPHSMDQGAWPKEEI